MTARQKQLGLHLTALVGGLGLLGFLVRQVGVGEVLVYLGRIGWSAPLLLLPSVLVALCDAKGWACAVPPTAQVPHIPLWRWSLARLAGEAINNLTPTANLGGEPVKAYLLRAHGLTAEAGLASVVAAKTALTVSQVIFILAGVPFFLHRMGWVQEVWWVFAPLVLLGYGFVTALIRWQRRGLAGMAVRGLRRLVPRWRRLGRWEDAARRVDAHLLHFYDGDPRSFAAATAYHWGGWVFGAVEIWLFLYAIGVPASPVDALIIETMVQPFTAAALVIPGALGVQEAGGVLLCRLLGLDDGAGLTLMGLKRAREAVYNLVGLLVIARVSGTLLPRDVYSR